MLWKVNILSSQIKDKFSPVEITKANILKDHVVERFTFGSHMLLKLSSLELTLNQFHTALNCCPAEAFLRMGTLYPEMSVHERAVDFYIELLRKDQLDENVPIETIEKSLTYFQQIFPLHLGQDANLVNHGQVLNDSLKTYNAACDCLHQLSSMIKCMMTSQDNSEMASMLKIADANSSEIRQVLKTMKRRLPSMGTDLSPTDPLIKFDAKAMDKMLENCKTMTLLVKAFYSLSRMVLQQNSGEVGIPPAKLMDLMFNIVDQVYEMSNDGVTIINKQLSESLKDITEMNKALQDGDWDTTEMIDRGQPPVSVRSEIFKNDITEAENLKYKIENKDLDIKELKKLLKMKTEEMSEMQVRKDKAEKRLSDASRESELMREKLQRKLDDANETLKRKEKEFEDTMDHLQKDLDSLESEKGELSKKLKETTMNVLLQGLAGKGSPSRSGLDHHRSGSSADQMSLGPSLPAPIKDSPMLMMQLQDLQLALASLRQDSYRRQGQELQQRLAKMKPIVVPTKTNLEVQSPNGEKKDFSKEDLASVDDLAKKVSKLRNRINIAITSKSVLDLSSRQVLAKKSPEILAFTPTTSKPMDPHMLAYQLQKDTEHLRLEVARLLASKRPGGQVEADFAQFPTPLMAKAMLEKDCQIVGRVKLTSKTVKTVPLIVGPSELKQIHQTVLY